MSASMHTRGPWSYRPHKHDDWGIVRAPVKERGHWAGGIICQARDPEALDEATLARHRKAKTDPWEANARLIAAAPCLLEALEALEAHGHTQATWAKALAAIAKARGAA